MPREHSDLFFRQPMQQAWALALLCSLGFITACGESAPTSNCVPATGTVLVDNVPAQGVMISLHSAVGGRSVAHGVSGENGEFVISTYAQGDGAEPGDYVVTCQWGTYNGLTQKYSDDRLKGKYANPKKSDIAWTLPADAPATPKRIELVTDKK